MKEGGDRDDFSKTPTGRTGGNTLYIRGPVVAASWAPGQTAGPDPGFHGDGTLSTWDFGESQNLKRRSNRMEIVASGSGWMGTVICRWSWRGPSAVSSGVAEQKWELTGRGAGKGSSCEVASWRSWPAQGWVARRGCRPGWARRNGRWSPTRPVMKGPFRNASRGQKNTVNAT
jgi:hypothetical protein